MALVRLDKYLADMGIASRKELKQIIKSGRVSIDGVAVKVPETKFDPESCVVAMDGETLCYKKFHYYMIDKPCGVVTATEDRKQKTVLDLLSPEMQRMGLFPVGRLDKDTTGLLLITDDGAFAHDCISPKKKISKTYIATLDGDVTDEMCEAFAKGVTLADGTLCRPAVLERIGDNLARIVITEGKYHQIKRMFGTVGLGVNALHRAAIGNLNLPHNMCEGDWIEMTKCALESQIN